jgi:hypothetical protein
MTRKSLIGILSATTAAVLLQAAPPLVSPAQAQQKPNILVIMGDDIGWENLGSYHQGLMLDATPNLDKLASEGMRFTVITRKPVARLAAPTSSLASCPSAPG